MYGVRCRTGKSPIGRRRACKVVKWNTVATYTACLMLRRCLSTAMLFIHVGVFWSRRRANYNISIYWSFPHRVLILLWNGEYYSAFDGITRQHWRNYFTHVNNYCKASQRISKFTESLYFRSFFYTPMSLRLFVLIPFLFGNWSDY